MSRLIKFSILLIVVSLIVSCSNRKRTHIKNEVDIKYEKLRSAFDPDFTSHFPERVFQSEIRQLHCSTLSTYEDFPSAHVTLYKTSKEIKKLEINYERQFGKGINAAESNLLIINNWLSLNETGASVERDEQFKKKMENLGKQNNPIPNFYELKFSNNEKTETQLSSDFNIFVLEAKKGMFWDLSEMSDSRYIPTEWKHGLSKGVAISIKQKIIIYWLIIW